MLHWFINNFSDTHWWISSPKTHKNMIHIFLFCGGGGRLDAESMILSRDGQLKAKNRKTIDFMQKKNLKAKNFIWKAES